MNLTRVPNLILLAGSTEAGKSTAGTYLQSLGAYRLKIRDLLLGLTSGRESEHEGVRTRVDFSPSEFVDALRDHVAMLAHDVVVVESFIDADLAETTREHWPGRAAIVFITAPRDVRIARLIGAHGLSETAARETIDSKDARKRVIAQGPKWRKATDYWIDNSASLAAFTSAIYEIYGWASERKESFS